MFTVQLISMYNCTSIAVFPYWIFFLSDRKEVMTQITTLLRFYFPSVSLLLFSLKDLVSVTKALLKSSGDFSAALDLLLNPFTVSLTFWNRHDDSLLQSADPIVRQQLQEKYGEENVAKRIVFLEVEG